jgi:type IV secretory pathway component VirB8
MNELNKNASELSKISKENPFRTPDNYFDDFSARLRVKIDAEKSATLPKRTRLIQILKPAFGLAASFALIFMLVYVPLKTFMPHHVENVAANTEEYDTETGILNYIENIDESSFISLLHETENDDTFSDDDLALFVSSNFNDYELYENLQNQ